MGGRSHHEEQSEFFLSNCKRCEDVDGRRHVDAIADPDRSRTWSSTALETDGRVRRVCALKHLRVRPLLETISTTHKRTTTISAPSFNSSCFDCSTHSSVRPISTRLFEKIQSISSTLTFRYLNTAGLQLKQPLKTPLKTIRRFNRENKMDDTSGTRRLFPFFFPASCHGHLS